DSPRSFRSPRTPYSLMVSPAGSAYNFQNRPRTPTIPQSLATTPSAGVSATPKTPARNPSIGYPIMPITPQPPPPCGHTSSGLGRICERCAGTATAYERWVSGIEEAELTYEQKPPGPEPIPETPPGATYEYQSSPLLSPDERREGPPIGLGIMMPGVPYEEQSLLLTDPLLEPPPASKKRKRKPPPLFPGGNHDTASATLDSKRTGTTFAPERVQNMSKDRSTFEIFREMSCTLEHCTIHGGDRGPSMAATTIVASNRDSCTTLAASMHSQSEDRKLQRAGKMDCALKHCDCGGCQVGGVGDRLESSRNERGVSWIVDGFLAALTKGVSWLKGKRW
ncbi:unnamed protein product, partial [Tuber aestivum]